jgi:hypothetical protein
LLDSQLWQQENPLNQTRRQLSDPRLIATALAVSTSILTITPLNGSNPLTLRHLFDH